MKHFKKKDFPVSNIRRFLEPGPIVLVSSAWKGKTNIMTMGWHMVMEFEPSRIGCYIWSENHSFDMVRNSKECVINIPTVDLATKVVGIGNTSGRDIDKFVEFGLTAAPGSQDQGAADCRMLCQLRVQAGGRQPHQKVQPLRSAGRESARGHIAQVSAHPALSGDGVFMLSGPNTSRYRQLFRPEML